MTERKQISQFDMLVDAVLARRDGEPPSVEAEIAPLVNIAIDLRSLPRQSFKSNLKAELERSISMSASAKPVPKSSYVATPYLSVRNATEAIEFYKKAFGATELMRLTDPSGKIGHATIRIGEAEIHLADSAPGYGDPNPDMLGGTAVRIALEVPDVDTFVQRAAGSGAKILRPVADQFYGARSGRLQDPYGHVWIVSTHIKDVPFEEAQRIFSDMMKQPATQSAEEPVRVAPIRKGFRSITPYLVLENANAFMNFLSAAFGGEEKFRMPGPGGKIMHAEASVAGSMIEFADATAEIPPMPSALHFYVPDVDAAYIRAVDAGATSIAAPADQSYGERGASLVDPCGNHWYLATSLGPTAVPAGVPNLIIYLHPGDASGLIEFMVKAIGAELAERYDEPDGRVAHAKLRLGDSLIEMSDARGPYKPMPSTIHYYLADTDAAYKRALEAGAKSLREPKDEPYGDRNAGVIDPAGNRWFFATHIKDVQF
jgi:PhnB protein